jgi:ferredoxin--NADP+ reductase
MAYVITGSCEKDTDCLEVCPVDCIHPRPNEPGFRQAKQLFIDPNACIHCASCFRICAAKAILAQENLPRKLRSYERANEEYFQPVGRSA